MTPTFRHVRLGAWGVSWLIAFPTLLLPLVHKLTSARVETA